MSELPSDTERTTRRIETLTAPMAFNTLFGLVEQVCLSRPIEVPKREVLSSDATVVTELGMRGLRAAIEFTQESVTPVMELGDLRVQADDQIRFPERYSDKLDRDALHKTEALGEALLDESFDVLGSDALEQVERFKNARSYEEQGDVIEWLCVRLQEITGNEEAERLQGEDDERFYHPLRLAPKLMGAYPAPKINPTCLGVSMLAASFFQKAGAEMLHGGVMRTRMEQQRISTIDLFTNLPATAERYHGTPLPQRFTALLEQMSDRLLRKNLEDNGYHAAVYVKLEGDQWGQIDTNFNACTAIDDEMLVGQLNDTSRTLQDLREVAPGLELGVEFPHLTLAQLLSLHLRLTGASHLPDATEIEAFLRDGNPEAFYERARTMFAEPFFKEHGDEEVREMMGRLMSESLFYNTFQSMFTKYVLHSQPAHEVLERCQKDEEYLQRRVEIFRIFPLMMAAGLAIGDVNNGRDMGLHQSIEVGLPAMRIGSAVLNDFANLYGEDLPPSFRVSQWPSSVPLVDAYVHPGHSDAEESLRVRNLLGQLGRLHYSKDDGIVYNTVIEQMKE